MSRTIYQNYLKWNMINSISNLYNIIKIFKKNCTALYCFLVDVTNNCMLYRAICGQYNIFH